MNVFVPSYIHFCPVVLRLKRSKCICVKQFLRYFQNIPTQTEIICIFFLLLVFEFGKCMFCALFACSTNTHLPFRIFIIVCRWDRWYNNNNNNPYRWYKKIDNKPIRVCVCVPVWIGSKYVWINILHSFWPEIHSHKWIRETFLKLWKCKENEGYKTGLLGWCNKLPHEVQKKALWIKNNFSVKTNFFKNPNFLFSCILLNFL